MSTTQSLGKVCVTPKGAWNEEATYAFLDLVTRGGGSYLAKQGVPAGTPVDSTAYWLQIAAKGDKGDKGNTGSKGDTGATGNGIATVEKTGTSGNVDTYTITFTNGDTTTFTVTNGSVTSVNGRTGAVTGVADTDKYYGTMSVGHADNLIDRKGNGTEQCVDYRTSHGNVSIEDDGSGVIEALQGNTIRWNQLAHGDFSSTENWRCFSSGDAMSVSDGVLTLTRQQTGNVGSELYPAGLTFNTNHKYLIKAFVRCDEYRMFIGFHSASDGTSAGNVYAGVDATSNFVELAIIAQPKASNNIAAVRLGGSDTPAQGKLLVKNFMLVDLTLVFGEGNEPETVDEFKNLFPRDYYDYNAGGLYSLRATGLETVGFNQFNKNAFPSPVVYDGKTCSKVYDTPTVLREDEGLGFGQIQVTYNALRTKAGTPINVLFSYADGTFDQISMSPLPAVGAWGAGSAKSDADKRVTKVAVSNGGNPESYAVYVDLDTVCVHYVWTGYRNGEYEEYWKNTLSLPITTLEDDQGNAIFSDGLKRVGNVYDEISPTSAIKRIGSRAYQSGDESDPDVLTDGTTTLYVLQTVQRYPIDPPLNFSYRVSDFGTERALSEDDDATRVVPLRAIIKYSDDYTRTIATLPKNYDTTGGLDALLSKLAEMLGQALGGTVTITRGAYREADQKYEWSCTFTPAETEAE